MAATAMARDMLCLPTVSVHLLLYCEEIQYFRDDQLESVSARYKHTE